MCVGRCDSSWRRIRARELACIDAPCLIVSNCMSSKATAASSGKWHFELVLGLILSAKPVENGKHQRIRPWRRSVLAWLELRGSRFSIRRGSASCTSRAYKKSSKSRSSMPHRNTNTRNRVAPVQTRDREYAHSPLANLRCTHNSTK